MKLYVSADIEGIAGISHWDEAHPEKPDYAPFRDRMTAHVAAACEGAVAGGATDILVQDAHAFARNIDGARLPRCARLSRGWSSHPLMMVQELDGSFDALFMIGYHSRAGSGGNPLAHTLSSSKIALVRLNGDPVSEFHLFGFGAADLGVPVVLVSGDQALCEDVRRTNANITTIPVLTGRGESTVSLHPAEAEERIRDGAKSALGGDLAACAIDLPDRFELEVRFHKSSGAVRGGFYPGARQTDDHVVSFEATEYFEVLRALTFLL